MTRLILIILIALFSMGQVSIDPVTESMVTKGRKIVDEYRQKHDAMYKNGGKQDSQVQSEIQGKMMTELSKLGFNPDKFKVIDSFFNRSDKMNINKLGYKDYEEFEEKATITDRAALSNMWK